MRGWLQPGSHCRSSIRPSYELRRPPPPIPPAGAPLANASGGKGATKRVVYRLPIPSQVRRDHPKEFAGVRCQPMIALRFTVTPDCIRESLVPQRVIYDRMERKEIPGTTRTSRFRLAGSSGINRQAVLSQRNLKREIAGLHLTSRHSTTLPPTSISWMRAPLRPTPWPFTTFPRNTLFLQTVSEHRSTGKRS